VKCKLFPENAVIKKHLALNLNHAFLNIPCGKYVLHINIEFYKLNIQVIFLFCSNKERHICCYCLTHDTEVQIHDLYKFFPMHLHIYLE
jgi:hypothetical protein